MEDVKRLCKIAYVVQDQHKHFRENLQRERLQRFGNFKSALQRITEDIGKYEKAIDHGWWLATKRIRGRVGRTIEELSITTQRNKEIAQDSGKVPEPSDLIKELKQLEDDCGPIDYDSQNSMISVTTEDIDLEGIYLGPFKIQLELMNLPDLYKNHPYYCIALNPNPASSSDNVTHPHVSDEKLCEGDGKLAIRNALEQGRLTDFFTIVISILNTYNPDSPYVSVQDWEGIPCYDCGVTVSGDSSYFCEFCSNDYCDYCSSYCRVCDTTTCLGCGGDCPVCGEFVCSHCVKECIECGETCCLDCLEEHLCPNCMERKQNEEDEPEETEENTKIENADQTSQETHTAV